LPAAVEDSQLRSPYGASYGGFAFQRNPTFTQATRIVESLVEWLEAEHITGATLTQPIAACAALPLDVVAFALLAAGFESVNRDLSSVVRLDSAVPVLETVESRARNAARKAEREGVTVQERGDLDDFWSVMEATFSKHGAHPTHTQTEFARLAETLPDRVYADLAYHDGEPVAGVGYFVINSLVNSSFYFCQQPDRRELNGLTLCVLRGLERAQKGGYRWFDFGTSTAGMEPRENVFRFKEQFASVGQFRETFEWHAG
jgi:Acetyltransferase (GNAT) domain